MDLQILAQKLIESVDGLVTEENIAGVKDVFDGIMQGVNNQWEDHLAKETEDMLMYDSVLCDCGSLIEIKRGRTVVYYSV